MGNLAPNLLLGGIAGAGVVIFGGGYAALLALARLRSNSALNLCANLCYAGLLVAVWLLAQALDLSGVWWLLVGLLTVGYWFAPRGIWHLSVATHGGHDD